MNPLAIPLPAVLPHPTDTRACPEFPLRLGGGKREAPPLPKGPSELGEANTGPRSLPPRVSRQKTQYQLQAGARGGGGEERGGKGEGPGERVRAPSARMQHCDKARPGRAGGGGARPRRPSAVLTPHSTSPGSVPPDARPERTGPGEKARSLRAQGARGAKQNGDAALPSPPPPPPAASRQRCGSPHSPATRGPP